MDAWRDMWRTEEAVAKLRNLEQVKDAISGHSALFAESLDALMSTNGVLQRWSCSHRISANGYLRTMC
jgi:hypothetical protein